MRIIRSSSYVYNIDDSFGRLDDAESLFRSLEMSSVPDLAYCKSDDIENISEPLRRRDLSAAPDFYHGSFHNSSDSVVNLSEFIKNQNEIFIECSEKYKKLANNVQNGVLNHETVADFQPLGGNAVLESTAGTQMQSSTQYTTMDANVPPNACIQVPGTFTQSSPYDIEMEVLVIPMVNDFNKTEIRIPTTSLSSEKKKVLKRIAAENELTAFYIGKGKSRYLVLRKKASLLQKQTAEREARIQIELEKKRKLEEMSAQVEDSPTDVQPCLCTVSMQTPSKIDASNINGIGKSEAKKTLSTSTSGGTLMNAAERRKARRAAERLRVKRMEEAKTKKKESIMQTCPQDWIICPWCTKDIPPAEQCGHIAMCRALHRQQNQEALAKAQLEDFRRKKHKNRPVRKSGKGNDHTLIQQNRERQRSSSASKRKSSRSRTRSVDPNLAAALKRQNLIEAQLKEVHPNDVNGMLHAAQRVCAVPNCTHIISATSGGQCSHCRFSFCPQHRPPHTGHSCSTALSFEKMNNATDEEDDIADRQAILKQRMRQRINSMAERRRR
nr:ribosomal protein s14 [Hymenolepis microstoma]